MGAALLKRHLMVVTKKASEFRLLAAREVTLLCFWSQPCQLLSLAELGGLQSLTMKVRTQRFPNLWIKTLK